MRYLLRIVEVALLTLLIAVSIMNSHPVEFKFFLGGLWRAPLIVFLLLFFVAGAGIGLLASFSYYIQMRRQIFKLKKELSQRNASKVVSDPSDAIAE